MAVVKPTEGAEVPLSRLGLNLVRYYLGNRWALLVLGAGVLLVGIGLNWNWLVAAGIAPILLSTLPCLVMCGLVCACCAARAKSNRWHRVMRQMTRHCRLRPGSRRSMRYRR